ncbi:hypothetical protein [Prescottella equi]|uniref:hypothetical protein n=1 Tax=Rhodococcus hoagii TaxID=43767 RepID=UPI0012F9722B|nr:hypothetical protein [Prescottella equi]
MRPLEEFRDDVLARVDGIFTDDDRLSIATSLDAGESIEVVRLAIGAAAARDLRLPTGLLDEAYHWGVEQTTRRRSAEAIARQIDHLRSLNVRRSA